MDGSPARGDKGCMLPLIAILMALAPYEAPTFTPAELIREALPKLVAMHEDGGQWPYEGVYRVEDDIPIGYRIGGTAIVGTTLLAAGTRDDRQNADAIQQALRFVLERLDDPLMAPSTENRYDVRVWGQAYALEFLCRVRAAGQAGERAGAINQWIPRLVATLIEEQIQDGGWNYANHRRHASFVTAPVTQALLLARAQDEKVPDEVFVRARHVLEKSRTAAGGFVYGGVVGANTERDVRAKIPGAIARSPACETTLMLLGGGSPQAVQAALDAFYEHWQELEKRRRKQGTHDGPYGIAPYYFYYGHRYAAQAIEMLPEAERPKERARLLEFILKTRDADGTWNDRVFPRSRNFGTAMIVLALLGEKTPMPPRIAISAETVEALPASESPTATRPAPAGDQ
jgi:hypothetical protein